MDATTRVTSTVAGAAGPRLGVVNGPEGEDLDWLSIDWRTAEDDVRRLRQRIFTASRAGDLKRVRSLQKLTAPRGALSYPRRSREELEGRFPGLMANLDPKW